MDSFFVGIFLVGAGFSSMFDYPFGDVRGVLEALFCFVPGGFAIWGGWKLAHPKPKPIYTDLSELPPPIERQPTADMEQQDRKKRTMNFCPHCGVKLSGESTYCPHCGKRLRD